MPPVIEVSAAVVVDDAGRWLLVRKRGTTTFMQPGGKPEPGETPAATLVRELAEEVGLVVGEEALEPLGTFTAAAANEDGHEVLAHVFRLLRPVAADDVSAAAEIEELLWFDPDTGAGRYPLAPLFELVVLDVVRRA